MTLTIPDEALKATGMTERELLIELACHLYDTDKLTKFDASRMVGMVRDEFDAELIKRGLALIHYTEKDIEQELETMRHLEETGFWKRKA